MLDCVPLGRMVENVMDRPENWILEEIELAEHEVAQWPKWMTGKDDDSDK